MYDHRTQEALAKRVRITQGDLKKHGYSERCPRCADLLRGHHKTNKSQSDECRIRIYGEYETRDPAEWRLVTQQLKQKVSEHDARGDDIEDDLPTMEGPAAQQRSDEQTFDDDYEPNDNSESAGRQDGDPEYAPAVDPVDWDQSGVGLFSDDEDAVMS